MGFMENLRSKYELYKLEQRYTRREKRTTFYSGAQYVDGEYVYSPSSSMKSDSSFGGGNKRVSTFQVKEIFSSPNGNSNKRSSRMF